MRRFAQALCAWLLFNVAPAIGEESRRSLPPFEVVSASGAAVSSAALSSEERWLLVYVTKNCIACDRLLAAFGEWQIPNLADRAVIVVGGDLSGARAYIEDRLPQGLALAWYADPDERAAATLQLPRAPALVAVSEGRIQWKISGVLNDPTLVEPAIRRWVER